MKEKWIPCEAGWQDIVILRSGQLALLTRRGKQGRSVNFRPGWCCNDIIAYMELGTLLESPELWKSEYRGDDPPERGGWFIVTVEEKRGKHHIEMACYDNKKSRWCREERLPDVLAYRDIPKPYKTGPRR